ncbi:MAG: hypothetical protein WB676_11040 [Bryobacteraceae bacterium]
MMIGNAYNRKGWTHMRKLLSGILFMFFTTACFADDAVAHWRQIVGVITAPGISNPVAGIASGGLPWRASAGRATVNLTTGEIAFFVEGLVLVGGNSSGTPDGVTSVKGTLVCNAGSTTAQAIIDTAAVPLDAEGNAEFRGNLASVPPSSCSNPLFLIRVSPANVWIATGAVRVTAQ